MDKCEWSIWLSVAHHSTLTRLWLGPTIQKESLQRKEIDSSFNTNIAPHTLYLENYFSLPYAWIWNLHIPLKEDRTVSQNVWFGFFLIQPPALLHSRQRDPTKQEENNWSSIISVCLYSFTCVLGIHILWKGRQGFVFSPIVFMKK